MFTQIQGPRATKVEGYWVRLLDTGKRRKQVQFIDPRIEETKGVVIG